MRRIAQGLLAVMALTVLSGCHMDMWIQPKKLPQAKSDFFVDQSATRKPAPGTVEFQQAKVDDAFYTGYRNGALIREFPIPVTKDLIERGRDRFGAFCQPCHGAAGDGKGMIAQRGLTVARPVASYHTDRLREMPVGHFYDVITNGYGVMYPFNDRISPTDRWAIASYIRALQLSRNASIKDVPAEDLPKLDEASDEMQPASGGVE